MPDSVTFDHTSPEVRGPAYWDAIRVLQDHGPLTWVESNGGFWAATSYDMVLRMAQDWETFSSGEGVLLNRPGPDVVPYIMPIDVDPPRQRTYRKQLNPHFVPKVLRRYEDAIADIADELIDTFIDRGQCDIAVDFARKFPGTVFFRLIVSCSDDDFRRVEPSARAISFESDDPEKFARGAAHLREWASGVLAGRDGKTRLYDVVDAVMHLRDGGEPFADDELLSGLQILAQGGIGTSASAIGVIMRVLAQQPELQDRVRHDRALVPALMEECLRLEPPVALMFRTVTRDIEIDGNELKKGDQVGLFFGAANRDPAVFERPDEVHIDRPHNRHLAFGAGPHRCIGSNLARLQIRIAIDRLVDRLAPFRIPEGAEITYFSGQARGPSSVPLEFGGRGPGGRA
jgi:cytochrome P450